MISQANDAISWSNVSATPVSTNDTFQISANGALVVVVYTNVSNMNSIVGVVQSDGSISWGNPQIGFDQCKSDSKTRNMCTVCLAPGNLALSFHASSGVGSTALWGTVGTVDPKAKSITWSNIDKHDVDDSGYEPSVAVNSTGGFVLVHRTDNYISGKDLYYRVGQVDLQTKIITRWGPKPGPYATGYLPRIAIYNNLIVQVHQSSYGFANLQMMIGQIDFAKGIITWQTPVQYGFGNRPTVSFDGTNVVEVHEAIDPSLLYSSYLASNRYTYDAAGQKVTGPVHANVNVGYGNVPCITVASPGTAFGPAVILGCINADNDKAGRDSFHTTDGQHFLSLGLSTMTGSLAPVIYGLSDAWISKGYNEVTFPGTHNSYSNPFDGDGGVNAPAYPAINRNNSLSIQSQLDLGVRCLVFEVHYQHDPLPNQLPLLVYHGPNLVGSGLPLCYSYPVNLCIKVKTWVEAHPNEIVTIYFDRQDDYVSADLIQRVCRAANLDQYVWDYITTLPAQGWPTLQKMISAKKTVMVVMPQVLLAAGTHGTPLVAENSYRLADGTTKPAWDAQMVTDLSPSALVTPVNPDKLPMFRDSNFCSRRAASLDGGYSTAGNPFQAARANQYQVVYPLAKAIDGQLAKQELVLSYIWCDFVDFNSYGLMQAAYQLNTERFTTSKAVSSNQG